VNTRLAAIASASSVRATDSKKFLKVFNRKHFNATAASKKAGTMTSSKSMVFGSEWL